MGRPHTLWYLFGPYSSDMIFVFAMEAEYYLEILIKFHDPRRLYEKGNITADFNFSLGKMSEGKGKRERKMHQSLVLSLLYPSSLTPSIIHILQSHFHLWLPNCSPESISYTICIYNMYMHVYIHVHRGPCSDNKTGILSLASQHTPLNMFPPTILIKLTWLPVSTLL